MGIPERKLAELARYRESEAFDELERKVLDFATGLSRNPAGVPDALRQELLLELGEAGLVQLAAVVAAESFVGRFNRGIGLEAQGFSEGAACLVPE